MRVSRRYLLWAAPAVVACLIAISFFAFGEPRSHEMQAIENPSDAADAAKASGYDDINFWTGEPIWTSTFGIPEQPDWTPIQQTAADNEDAVDRAVAEHAKQAKATVQVATAMLLGKTYEARLIVEHGSGAATLEIARESRASIVVDKLDISVTGEVMAKVSSPSFDVLPTSPETLTLAQDKVGVWTWNVVPKEEGEVNLTFNLYNIVSFDLIQHSSPVKRFPQVVTVSVGWRGVAREYSAGLADFFLSDRVVGLSVTVGFVVSGVGFGWERFQRRRRAVAAQEQLPEAADAAEEDITSV